MIKVFLADPQAEERSALRLLLNDLKMEVVGEAVDWSSARVEVPLSCPEILLVDRELLPGDPNPPLEEIRAACTKTLIIVLIIDYLDPRQQAELAPAADLILSKLDSPARIAERLRDAMHGIHS
jgi:DNA-binding NarL/FixJ family response regulator